MNLPKTTYTRFCEPKKHAIILLLMAASSLLVSGCVTPISLDEQTPEVSYQPTGKTLISVVDQRHRVLNGESPALIGKAHGVFGIPANWHVTPVLSTEEEDEGKTLAEYLQHRIVAGLRNSNWDVEEQPFRSVPDGSRAAQALSNQAADFLLLLTLKEWYFSINLNWVTAFNFDTEVDINIFDQDGNTLVEKNIKDRDLIDEKATESPQNLILGAYREQLRQILFDPEVSAALRGGVAYVEPAEIPVSSSKGDIGNAEPAETQVLTEEIDDIAIEELSSDQKTRLEALEQLRDDGIFSEQEFIRQREKILKEGN